MFLDYAENIVQLLVNLLALLMCLFQYIGNKRKAWVYAIAFFLANLTSCYYWTVYMVVMGDSPNVSSLISDSGSNIAYFILLLLVIKMKGDAERRYFHPLMLLPIPFGIFQLGLYLIYGNVIYAAGDRAFYLELVRRFAENAEEGARTIRRDYEAKDIRDYQIRTHTLKSAARQIGANALSDMAQAQENAAKDGDWDAVRAGADALVLRYEAAGNELKAAVGAPAGAEASPGDAVASEVGATEAVAILREALNALDDFEAERAAALLRPLQDASAGDIALREPIEAIQAALEDFDGMTAANRISGLIDAIGKGKA